MKIEFLWFDDCPNHLATRSLLGEVLNARGTLVNVEEIDATDPAVAALHRFPGSPTIRVNGADIEPGFVDPGDYTPRCRLYSTAAGLKGIPERRWIEDAIAGAQRTEIGDLNA